MLVIVALFFLLAVLGPVLSAPLPAGECSSSVVLEGKSVKVTTLLSNHRCSVSHLFESLFGDDDVLTSTVGDGDAHKVCVGFLELVKVGEAGNLLENICSHAKFTEEVSYGRLTIISPSRPDVLVSSCRPNVIAFRLEFNSSVIMHASKCQTAIDVVLA